MTPLEKYQQLLTNHVIKPDAQQANAIEKLNDIYLTLTHQSFWEKLIRPPTIEGLYMWGSVGIGKTFLMDLFFECANFPKQRMHFFNFLQHVHQQLKFLQGQPNPLLIIAKEISKKTKVLCFDEMFVKDIADAMLLGELFKYLFERRVVIITTSNVNPDDLYHDGIQRERFLPAIAAIKAHMHILHLTHVNDYRQHFEKPAHSYFYPLDHHAHEAMLHAFQFYCHDTRFDTTEIVINTHILKIIRKHQGVIWCQFNALCMQDRSHNDYLQLADNYHTVLIDGVTHMPAKDRKTILRFIHMIDIFYDKHVRVIISAETTADKLYTKGPYTFEYQRTLSRLTEMQSSAYIDTLF